MTIEGYTDYKRREYCNDINCKIQTLLNANEKNPEIYEDIRNICKTNCIHTTYEFHHWLIDKGYEIVRPE